MMRCDFVPKLEEWIERFRGMPFEYGTADCIMFSCGWVKFATGYDPMAPFGTWSNQHEALNAISIGGGTLADAVDTVLPPMPVARAQIGDLVSFPQEHGNMEPIGICLGVTSIFLLEDGMHRVKTSACNRAWEALCPHSS